MNSNLSSPCSRSTNIQRTLLTPKNKQKHKQTPTTTSMLSKLSPSTLARVSKSPQSAFSRMCKTPSRIHSKNSPFHCTPTYKQGNQDSPTSTKKQSRQKKTVPFSLFDNEYDRFIPNRQTMDLNTSQFNLQLKDQSFLDSSQIAYQEQVAKACGIALDKRILTFNSDPPFQSHSSTSKITRPLRKSKRKIPQAPEKVLDAPGLLDDYYLNLLDWSQQNILAIALDKSVYIWNAESGEVSDFCSTAHDDYVSSVQFTADGSYLAVGTFLGSTQIYDVEASSKIRSMGGHSSRVSVLSWDKHLVSSGARDGSIWNHDVRIQNHKVSEYLNHTAEICGLKWRPDGQQLASGGNDNLVNIWDARASTPRYTFTEHTAAVKAIAWCPWQLSTLGTGGGSCDRHVYFWNTSNGHKTSEINTGAQVTSIIWSREYKEFTTSHGFPQNHLSVWAYPTLEKITDLPGHDSRVLHTALSPDGQTVASAASDENLKFWKVFESKKGVKSRGDESELVNATRRLAIR